MQRDASHQAQLANMNRVADKVKEVKNSLMSDSHNPSKPSFSRHDHANMFKRSSKQASTLETTSQERARHPLWTRNAMGMKKGHRRAASADTSVRG